MRSRIVRTVYVALVDEGLDVWRPAQAKRIQDDIYELLPSSDYDPTDERWQFPPGTRVVCEERPTADGSALFAVRRI